MKTSSRESYTLKKPQYSSKIVVSSNTTSNKNGSKINYTRRGNSTESYRQNSSIGLNENENDINLNSLITQATKGSSRPSTGGNINLSAGNYNTQVQMNSPRPNTERFGYSLSPSRHNNNRSLVKYLPPKSNANINKKTLVLDLDETLVHSGFKPFSTKSDIILKIELDNKTYDIHVLVRPGVEEFLEKMSMHYELVVFTASLSKYADPLVDILDPKRKCIFRLFRQHCTEINRAFVKDLKKLDRDLKDLIILDNSPISYALNVENGFPIKNWYEDRNDRELYNITPILEFLAYVPDVRDVMKLIVERNEITLPKALDFINKYSMNVNLPVKEGYLSPNYNSSSNSNFHKSTHSKGTGIGTVTSTGTGTVTGRGIGTNEYVYKMQNNEEKDLNKYKYSSNLISQKEREKYLLNPINSNNKNNSNILNSSSNSDHKYKQATTSDSKTDQENKQNINIKIINHHINHYIINQDGKLENSSVSNATKVVNPPDSNKKQKNINTFRNRYVPTHNESMNKSNNTNQSNTLNKSNNSNISNYELAKNKSEGYNLKSFNMNIGSIEVKSPVLKNNQKFQNIHNVQNIHPIQPIHSIQPLNTNSNNLNQPVQVSNQNNYTQSRYSSLIDRSNFSENTSRPCSAVGLKGRHTRDTSSNSLKNASNQINYNVNYNSPLARSPSSNSVIHNLNRNYSSKHNLKKETTKNNYLSNIDIPMKNINIYQGNRTVRPSTTHEKLKINYNTNINYSNFNTNNPTNNINQIKTTVRYEVDDIINKRGYSLSSRAADMRTPSYKLKDGDRYHPALGKKSKLNIGSKFSANGVYRSSSQNKK